MKSFVLMLLVLVVGGCGFLGIGRRPGPEPTATPPPALATQRSMLPADESHTVISFARPLVVGDTVEIGAAIETSEGGTLSCNASWWSLNPDVVTIRTRPVAPVRAGERNWPWYIVAHKAGSATVIATCPNGVQGGITVDVSPRP